MRNYFTVCIGEATSPFKLYEVGRFFPCLRARVDVDESDIGYRRILIILYVFLKIVLFTSKWLMTC